MTVAIPLFVVPLSIALLALFVPAKGHPDIVQAQITGSIIGTRLFGLGP